MKLSNIWLINILFFTHKNYFVLHKQYASGELVVYRSRGSEVFFADSNSQRLFYILVLGLETLVIDISFTWKKLSFINKLNHVCLPSLFVFHHQLKSLKTPQTKHSPDMTIRSTLHYRSRTIRKYHIRRKEKTFGLERAVNYSISDFLYLYLSIFHELSIWPSHIEKGKQLLKPRKSDNMTKLPLTIIQKPKRNQEEPPKTILHIHWTRKNSQQHNPEKINTIHYKIIPKLPSMPIMIRII